MKRKGEEAKGTQDGRPQQDSGKAGAYRSLFIHNPQPMWVYDLESLAFLDVNAAAVAQYGYSRDEFLSMTIAEIRPPGDVPALLDNVSRVTEGLDRAGVWHHCTKDGTVFEVEITSHTLEFEGRPAELVVAQNVHDHLATLNALAEREAQYRLLVENQTDLVVKVDPEGRFLFVSPSYCDLFGESEAELLGSTFMPLVHEEDRETTRQAMESLYREPFSCYVEQRAMTRHGWRWLAWVDTSVRDDGGAVVAIIGVGRDITDKKLVEEALQASERRFRRLVERSADAIFLHDDSGRFLDVNRAACEGLGYHRDQLLELSVQDVDTAFEQNSGRPEALGDLAPEQVLTLEGEYRRQDGSTFPVEIRVAPFESEDARLFLSTVRDISERRRAEEERKQLESKVQHAQKLESLGVLAGGIAHDFNNLLMGILGNADLALLGLTAESAGREHVKRIVLAAQRAAELTNQMLAYSGKGRFLVEPINLNRLLGEMDQLLRTVISKKAVLRYHLAEELPSVEADASQIRQVVMNLILNASDALGERTGSVQVSSGVVQADSQYLSGTYLDDPLSPGEYVYLEVSDTGCGMDVETRERIFDPFYTSKFAGRGLGLAAVLGIVRGHRGGIRLYSAPGRGTRFKILLPCSERQPVELPAAATHTEPAVGAATVLLVDDDPHVRQVAGEMLRHAGHAVLTADDGQQAVECFAAQPDTFDAVVLDMTMPRMDGAEAFQELRRIRPEVRVILSSGYNEQDATNRFAGKGLAGFIQKPYRAADLVAKLREVLDKQPTPPGTGAASHQEQE